MPAIFIIVVSGVVFLMIFFGAWAISVDAADQGRELTFGAVASGAALQLSSDDYPQPGKAGGLAAVEPGDSKADTWWGDALLLACPFH